MLKNIVTAPILLRQEYADTLVRHSMRDDATVPQPWRYYTVALILMLFANYVAYVHVPRPITLRGAGLWVGPVAVLQLGVFLVWLARRNTYYAALSMYKAAAQGPEADHYYRNYLLQEARRRPQDFRFEQRQALMFWFFKERASVTLSSTIGMTSQEYFAWMKGELE